MGSLFPLLGCNLSYIVDLFAALLELASASARTLLKLASSVRALLKPYGDTSNINFAVLEKERFKARFSALRCMHYRLHGNLSQRFEKKFLTFCAGDIGQILTRNANSNKAL